MGSPIALQELLKSGFEDFAIPSYETVAVTSIQNRAGVTKSLKAIAGVERVLTKRINLLGKELGPYGERVWELDNKDSRIRLVGTWSVEDSANGVMIGSTVVGDFLEVTFYGTGLNILAFLNATVRDFRAQIDSSAEGANILSTYSVGNSARNYSSNGLVNVTKGLSLGWHTVKIKNYSTNPNGMWIYGLEILNERSDIAILAGQAISKGNNLGLSALSASSFKDGVTGTRGARVVKYLQDGTVKSAVQEVGSSAYLSNTSHSLEEVMRRVNFREFGAIRADDFTSNATGAKAFTLEDNTTTLVASSGVYGTFNSLEGIGWSATGNFITLTFVGTGLDISYTATGLSAITITVAVDGVSVSGNPTFNNGIYTTKICSGLPYGTHTVKLTYTSGTGTLYLTDFIIYQPKKPSIPDGTVEVADYNVLADFVANTTVGLETIATGTVRKHAVKEFVCSSTGSFTINNITPTQMIGGLELLQSVAAIGGQIKVTFWGTGFDWRQIANTNTGTLQFALNGTNLTSANFPTASIASYGFTSGYNSSLGTQDQVNASTAYDAGVRCSGLPLGVYVLTVTTTTASQMRVSAVDIITPIYVSDSLDKVASVNSSVKYSPKKKRRIIRKTISSGVNTTGANPAGLIGGLEIGKTYRLVGNTSVAGTFGTSQDIGFRYSNGNTSNYVIGYSSVTSAYLSISSSIAQTLVAQSTVLFFTRVNQGTASGNASFDGYLEEILDDDIQELG